MLLNVPRVYTVDCCIVLHCIHIPYFIYIGWTCGLFSVWAITKKVTMDILDHVSWCPYACIFVEYMPGLQDMVSLMCGI